MSDTATRGVLTTTQASRLVHRAESSIRRAIATRALAADNEGGRWLIRIDNLLVWDAHTRRQHRVLQHPSADHSADLLGRYGSLSADELAVLSDVHPGNARKHLAILAKQGRAERLPDGQWTLITAVHQGVA